MSKSELPLLSHIPDDIAIHCLVKVPRRFHHNLRYVSKRWRAVLLSEEWLRFRLENKLEESWIYIMCKNHTDTLIYALDPEACKWRHIHNIPHVFLDWTGSSLETVGRKLYLLGGYGVAGHSNEAHCYDPFTEAWNKIPAVPNDRPPLLSVSVGDKIYVTGWKGSGPEFDSWDIYDSQSGSWTSGRSSRHLTNDLLKSICFDGKIYNFHKRLDYSHYARVYDLSTRKWDNVHNELKLCYKGPTVVVNETLYMLDETSGTKLMMWQSHNDTEGWVSLGKLSVHLTRPPCQLAAVSNKIFVIGCGMSVVVVDVDIARNAANGFGGMLVTTSITPPLPASYRVIACKTIAI